jgi:hypothetical protein
VRYELNDKPEEEELLSDLFDHLSEELIDLETNIGGNRDPSIVNNLPNQTTLKRAAKQLLNELDLAMQIRDLGHEL